MSELDSRVADLENGLRELQREIPVYTAKFKRIEILIEGDLAMDMLPLRKLAASLEERIQAQEDTAALDRRAIRLFLSVIGTGNLGALGIFFANLFGEY